LNSPNPPLLLLLFHQARITKRHRPQWNYKVAQMLDFTWEPFKPENPQMAVRLARTRRIRKALCLAV
jgi:hypothetical protein